METVLITGASSGIGAGLAREFARRGAHVALVARRVEQLEALAVELRAAGGQASAHRGDVTVDGDIARVVVALASQGLLPDIVVANAGFGVVGKAQNLALADYQRQIRHQRVRRAAHVARVDRRSAAYPGPVRDHGERGELSRGAGRLAIRHEQVRGTRAGGGLARRSACAARRLHADFTRLRGFGYSPGRQPRWIARAGPGSNSRVAAHEDRGGGAHHGDGHPARSERSDRHLRTAR